MKKFYVTMFAMLCGAAAMAQDIKVSLADAEATADGATQCPISIKWEADQVAQEKIVAFSFNLNLPKGVDIAKVFDEDEEGYVPVVDWSSSCRKAHTPGMGPLTGEGANGYICSAYSQSFELFKYTKGEIVNMALVVDPSVEEGEYEIKLDKMEFASREGEDKIVLNPADVVAKLTVKGGTGIVTINADDANAPIYNVAGQQVSKAQKGIFIQNGKKIAVK